MPHSAPGKYFRKGITMLELYDMFPDEQSAEQWFEQILWQGNRICGHCGSGHTKETKGRKPMPYWCTDCRNYFSVRTGTNIEKSRIPLRKWAFAVYLFVTSLKGISSMKLHRDIGVTQKTAWFMLHRLRESWDVSGLEKFIGPVEADETYMGGKRRNMHGSKRSQLSGRGAKGKTAVAGLMDREINQIAAEVIDSTDASTLQDFIRRMVEEGSTLFTDDHLSYKGIDGFKHESVKHSIGEYVRGMAHTNGVESFWATLKRAHTGTYHSMSPKHLQRYVNEFAGRHGIRSLDTIDQMRHLVAMGVGKKLMYRDLTK